MKNKNQIEIIQRFAGQLVGYSVDGGKTFHPTVKQAFQDLEIKLQKEKDTEVIQTYVEHLTPLIADARNKVVKAGASPKVMYIGDIFPRKKDELRPSAMKYDTGCKIFGMKIIADYRVPIDKFYIVQGEL